MERVAWLLWRHQGIGSSDAAAVHDLKDAFKTRLQLVEEKIKDEPPAEETNFILDKGNRLEPIARRHFQSQYFFDTGIDLKFDPQTFEYSELNFMRASLDGFAEHFNLNDARTERIGIEIKYLGKEPFAAIDKGEVPRKYWIQMQHQMLVAGLDYMFFVGCVDDKGIAYTLVKPDPEFMKLHIQECANVWRMVLDKKLPEPSANDYKEIKKKGAKALAKRYQYLDQKIKALEAEKKEVKDKFLGLVDHPRMTCSGVLVLKVERAGNVDYAKIPELKGVDLEKYRKAATSYYKITTDK